LLNWIFDTNISGVLLISTIAGMANMIPFVGPFMGMVPAIIVSLFNNLGDPVAASHFYFILHIIGMFLIVQMIDNNIISPIVVSGSMEMHPLTVILLILVGFNNPFLISEHPWQISLNKSVLISVNPWLKVLTISL
jgi:predicted PurR-regulated permease PerM